MLDPDGSISVTSTALRSIIRSARFQNNSTPFSFRLKPPGSVDATCWTLEVR